MASAALLTARPPAHSIKRGHSGIPSSSSVAIACRERQPKESGRRSAAVATLSWVCPKGWTESPPRAESEERGSLEMGGFRRGLGFGQRRPMWSRGENRAKPSRNSVSKGRNPLWAQEEDEDPEDKNVSLPFIGEIPLTRSESRMFTPMKMLVWLVLVWLAVTAWGVVSSLTIFNPAFLMYSSWILIKWPLPAAIAVGIATLVTAYRAAKRQPTEKEQVLLLVGSLTWLILVPVGLFQGFVDGWPLILFTIYVGFFLISAVVRYRLYGDLESRDKDKQWDTLPSRMWQIGFVISVVACHWLAAYEAPFLTHTWNLGWGTIVAILTLISAVVMHYTATYFLGKYFNRLVRPRAVVMFGPYRVVRHPIYSSYMLLFSGYCLALRAYMSMLILLICCIAYYEQRTKLEEDMLVEAFDDLYEDYRDRVRNKYFPLLY